MSQPYYPPPPPPMAPPGWKPASKVVPAWLAFSFGIVGVIGIPLPILNNATALLAAAGVICGAIALFGSRKAIAGTGLVLCLGGVIGTVAIQAHWSKELDKIGDNVVRDASGAEATLGAGPGAGRPKPTSAQTTWGKRYTWPDGLAVEVSVPAACKPSKYASPDNIQRAVKVTVLITNGSAEPFDAAMLTFGGDAQFAGKTAEKVFDSAGGCGAGGLDSGTVLPGKTFTYEVALSVGAAPGELQLVFEPHFGGDKAVFVGQA